MMRKPAEPIASPGSTRRTAGYRAMPIPAHENAASSWKDAPATTWS